MPTKYKGITIASFNEDYPDPLNRPLAGLDLCFVATKCVRTDRDRNCVHCPMGNQASKDAVSEMLANGGYSPEKALEAYETLRLLGELE